MEEKKTGVTNETYNNASLNPNKYIVQDNSLITGKQNLSTNAAKILRLAILQVEKNDKDLKPYIVPIRELAAFLGIREDCTYEIADEISDELMGSKVYVRMGKGSKQSFIKINMVSYSMYDRYKGFVIKLNSDIKPYLLGLKDGYTQYQLDSIFTMRSVYGIRIFELLQSKIMVKVLPREGLYFEMSVQYIRECLGLEEKYKKWSQFKTRVLDRAIQEICDHTTYIVTYETKKTGKTITDINFHIKYFYA